MDERRMGPRESADGAGNPQNAGTGGGGAGGGGISTDAELSVRAIVFFGAGLGVTMIVICAIVWLMVVWFKGRAEELDPARSPLAEANAPRLPPEPRLQGTPVADMRRLRAE